MQSFAGPVEQVTALSSRFTTAGFPHAFGGTVALAAYGGARKLGRIDLHVFLEPREAEAALARLAVLGVSLERAETAERLAIRGHAELRWNDTPLRVHFGTDGFHGLARHRVRRVPFAERWIYVLSAEDALLGSSLSDGAAGDALRAELVAAVGPELDPSRLRDALAQLGIAPPSPDLERLLTHTTP